MKLVKPSFEIIEQKAGYEGLLRHIEKCGRTCYKSEDKITEDSAEKFVNMIINRGHTAMLEHGTVYLTFPLEWHYEDDDEMEDNWYLYECYKTNAYSYVHTDFDNNSVYITTNYRVLLQNGWLDDLKYQCEPTEHHIKRVTVKFICDRGVSHEFVRHRVFSFAQESTRYCNYSKNKFGNECTFIIPSWLDLNEGTYQYNGQSVIINLPQGGWIEYDMGKTYTFLRGLSTAEEIYFQLLDNDYEETWIAQQARAVLPNSLKTELVMTGTLEQWEGFFKLRDDEQHAHPQAYELAHPLHEEFIKREWVAK